MSYYDNVKDNVKKQASGNTSGSSESSSAGGNFDTLKEAASETEPDEEKGDDTPIEVLEEDGLSRNPKRNTDLSVVEDKLDTIIDQNQKLIEILQSFAE